MFNRKTVSYLASGRGSNFEAVCKQIHSDEIPAKNGILISDNKDARALEKAEELGMESFFVDQARYATREEHEKEMVRLLKKAGTDLIVAAGYMRLLTPWIIQRYHNRIINIHPALLPSFPGVKAQKQALEYGVKITGCTVHFIDEGTDTGPIIIQSPVPVEQDDTIQTLSARILMEEHRILCEAVRLFCTNRLTVRGRKVIIS